MGERKIDIEIDKKNETRTNIYKDRKNETGTETKNKNKNNTVGGRIYLNRKENKKHPVRL